MEHHTIQITDCKSIPHTLTVAPGDEVKFCTPDSRSYQLTGLGTLFEDQPGRIDVPDQGCTRYYLVIGAKGRYQYEIGPDCSKRGTPDIIIVN